LPHTLIKKGIANFEASHSKAKRRCLSLVVERNIEDKCMPGDHWLLFSRIISNNIKLKLEASGIVNKPPYHTEAGAYQKQADEEITTDTLVQKSSQDLIRIQKSTWINRSGEASTSNTVVHFSRDLQNFVAIHCEHKQN